MANKPIYMLLSEVKKTSSKFDATHKVALYDVSKTSNDIPKWFKKFHQEEFKPLQDTVIKLQTEPPQWFMQWSYQFEQRINKRFDQLESRIDNLVAKNNLKE